MTKAHEPFYAAELADVPPGRMVVQPANRGTLPAILLSLIRLVRLDRHAVVAFFPVDHYYAEEGKFVAEVGSAFASAETTSRVILLGASPTTPEIEYGWIEPETTADPRLMRVRRFWEKPPYEVAQTLLDQGCLWNTFVMVGRANAFLELIQSAEPGLYETFHTAIVQCKGEMNPDLTRAVYEQIETADFSKRGLSGATERLAVLSLGEIGWDDLGEPRRVGAILSQGQSRKPVGCVAVSEVASAATARLAF